MSDELRARGEEMQAIQAREAALWAMIWQGVDTPYLRERIRACEAVRAALCGYPGAMAEGMRGPDGKSLAA
ncbi:hypothetical protein [Streptomyces synnematoformans]|uniref:Uncharacterized protein n=1 Tax=Streptomyces synnematoformans TaxID=415721 RepID=A0ABP5KNK1_9ACTN